MTPMREISVWICGEIPLGRCGLLSGILVPLWGLLSILWGYFCVFSEHLLLSRIYVMGEACRYVIFFLAIIGYSVKTLVRNR
jgi:hypothetical protein